MEALKTYIESGVLELYVLGQLGFQERAGVDDMAVKHPEVKQELDAIEIALEKYALHNAIPPSAAISDALSNVIKQETDVTIRAISDRKYELKIRTLRIALVACIALLVMSIAAFFNANHKLNYAEERVAELKLEKEKFASSFTQVKYRNTELQKIADMHTDPDWKAITLKGTAMDPEASMVVYWHTSGRHVMMDNSKLNLPANDRSHQYQLWALVNGKPIDLGVFDVAGQEAEILIEMKDITGAQTFAVTLEKQGGSVAPTLDQMIVAGDVI